MDRPPAARCDLCSSRLRLRLRLRVRVRLRLRLRLKVRLKVRVRVRLGLGLGLGELGRAEGVLQLELRDKREAAVYLDHVVGEEVGARRAQLLGEADGDEAVVRVGPLVRVRVGVGVWG